MLPVPESVRLRGEQQSGWCPIERRQETAFTPLVLTLQSCRWSSTLPWAPK